MAQRHGPGTRGARQNESTWAPTILVRPWRWTQNLQHSLFALPSAFVISGAVAAEVAVRLDRAGLTSWLPGSSQTSVVSARSLLAAVASGTITVVTLVLTLTLIAIQLAAGQLSPRTISDYLDDRFQQISIGVVLGTSAYSLTSLRAIDGSADDWSPDLTVLVAFLLTMLSLLMLLASVDRMAGRLQVGNLIDSIADETCKVIENADHWITGPEPDQEGSTQDDPQAEDSGAGGSGTGDSGDEDDEAADAHFLPLPAAQRLRSVVSPQTGWVRAIDEESLVEAIPENSTIVLRHMIGSFVYKDMELADLHLGDRKENAEDANGDDDGDEDIANAVVRAIDIGDSRSMDQDIGFGLTRLVDIALRALSPGINDPNTAIEVIHRLGQVVLKLQGAALPGTRAVRQNRVLIRPRMLDRSEYTRAAFDQIRRAAAEQPYVLKSLGHTLQVIMDETERRGLKVFNPEPARQLNLIDRRLDEFDEFM